VLYEDEEEEPAFISSSPQISRPTIAHSPPPVQASSKDNESPNQGSDSFSGLSDASISKSALEEALEEHLRRVGVWWQVRCKVRSEIFGRAGLLDEIH
jgi:hypothetical protein